MRENLDHYTPTDYQYSKFKQINSDADREHEAECYYYNDCSICPRAIHQYLFITEKHTCVRGMTLSQFETAMDNADCTF